MINWCAGGPMLCAGCVGMLCAGGHMLCAGVVGVLCAGGHMLCAGVVGVLGAGGHYYMQYIVLRSQLFCSVLWLPLLRVYDTKPSKVSSGPRSGGCIAMQI